VIKSESQRFV
jgi:hypothetical protein